MYKGCPDTSNEEYNYIEEKARNIKLYDVDVNTAFDALQKILVLLNKNKVILPTIPKNIYTLESIYEIFDTFDSTYEESADSKRSGENMKKHFQNSIENGKIKPYTLDIK